MQSGVGAPGEINGALLHKHKLTVYGAADGSGRLENVHLRPSQVFHILHLRLKESVLRSNPPPKAVFSTRRLQSFFRKWGAGNLD